MDLLDELRRPESKTLEFKRDLSSSEGLLRTVVAFANTAGGTVLVGVEDGTRHVRGIADPFALEERIASLITDSIAPRLLPDLEILAYRSTHVVAVQVHPSPARPHHLVRAGARAGTYVRVGSTNRRADDALIAEMQRFARGQAFDESAMPGLDSEAIDFRAASESFAAVRRLGRRDLQTLHLVRGRLVRSGLLLRDRGAHPTERPHRGSPSLPPIEVLSTASKWGWLAVWVQRDGDQRGKTIPTASCLNHARRSRAASYRSARHTPSCHGPEP